MAPNCRRDGDDAVVYGNVGDDIKLKFSDVAIDRFEH
jgi:hypothetical protein